MQFPKAVDEGEFFWCFATNSLENVPFYIFIDSKCVDNSLVTYLNSIDKFVEKICTLFALILRQKRRSLVKLFCLKQYQEV